MKNMFRNETESYKMKLLVSETWMFLKRGEGEEEIANHGWSRVESFSQETVAIGQRTSRNDEHEPKLRSFARRATQSQVQDARDSRTLTPLFFSSREAGHAL